MFNHFGASVYSFCLTLHVFFCVSVKLATSSVLKEWLYVEVLWCPEVNLPDHQSQVLKECTLCGLCVPSYCGKVTAVVCW